VNEEGDFIPEPLTEELKRKNTNLENVVWIKLHQMQLQVPDSDWSC